MMLSCMMLSLFNVVPNEVLHVVFLDGPVVVDG